MNLRNLSIFLLTLANMHTAIAELDATYTAKTVGEPQDSQREMLDCLIEPNEEVKLSSQVPGVLDKLYVERGDTVKKQQIVAKLKSGVEQAAVELAQAKVEFGQRKLVRNEDLYKQELISVHEKDEMETEHRISELELKETTEKLKLRTIRSPIDGIVIERHHSAGEFIGEDPVFTLVSIDPLNVEIIVPSSQLGKISKGMKAYVYPEYSDKQRYTATVDIVDPVVDAASGTFTVRVKLANPGNKIAVGLKCKVGF